MQSKSAPPYPERAVEVLECALEGRVRMSDPKVAHHFGKVGAAQQLKLIRRDAEMFLISLLVNNAMRKPLKPQPRG